MGVSAWASVAPAANAMKLAWGYIRTQVATTVHKFWVTWNILRFIVSDFSTEFRIPPHRPHWRLYGVLLRRALLHDLSKYRWDEAKAFAETIDQLRTTTYGTDGYQDLLRKIKPAINRHYARNRHHPEFHDGGHGDGFQFMTRVDRIEMIADWGAAVRRHKDGDLEKSLQTNAERFGYDEAQDAQLRVYAKQMGLLDKVSRLKL